MGKKHLQLSLILLLKSARRTRPPSLHLQLLNSLLQRHFLHLPQHHRKRLRHIKTIKFLVVKLANLASVACKP